MLWCHVLVVLVTLAASQAQPIAAGFPSSPPPAGRTTQSVGSDYPHTLGHRHSLHPTSLPQPRVRVPDLSERAGVDRIHLGAAHRHHHPYSRKPRHTSVEATSLAPAQVPLLANVSYANMSALHAQQYDSLWAMYDGLQGPHWTHAGNWSRQLPNFCFYYGVACDADGNVALLYARVVFAYSRLYITVVVARIRVCCCVGAGCCVCVRGASE